MMQSRARISTPPLVIHEWNAPKADMRTPGSRPFNNNANRFRFREKYTRAVKCIEIEAVPRG